jgi:hypothetical protein
MGIRGDLGTAWWQNVYTQSACVPRNGVPTVINTVVQCRNTSAPARPSQSFACPTTNTTNGGTDDNASTGNDAPNTPSTLNIVLIAVCGVFAIAAVVLWVQYRTKSKQFIELTNDQGPVMNAAFDGPS